jgi:transposase-like protein
LRWICPRCRDVEDALREIGDGQLLLSRSAVSRISDALWEEYEAFAQRELGGYDIVYLFADAIYESLREQVGLKEGILATWAILADGGKALIHLSLGNKESYEDWLEHFRDLLLVSTEKGATVFIEKGARARLEPVS